MLKRNCCILLLLLSFSGAGFAQQELYGRIIKKGSREVLSGVNVSNINQNKYNISDMGGNYKIPARAGDTIVFSSAGYRSDTAFVAADMLSDDYLVPLVPNVVALPNVEVDEMSKYEADSLKRREDYDFLFAKKHPVKLMNGKREGDAPGLNFSPIGYFSSGEKQERNFKKRVLQQEEDYYIDYKFSVTRVAQLTRLTGDSLHTFMLRYRPTYKFCRAATSKDILLYINDKVMAFRKGQ
jgi:hypothetical protein